MYEYYVPRLPPPGTISTSGKGVDKADNEENNLIRAAIITVVTVVFVFIVIIIAYNTRINYQERVRKNFLIKNFKTINPDINIPDTEVKQIIKHIKFLPVGTTKLPSYSYCLYNKKNTIDNCHIAYGKG